MPSPQVYPHPNMDQWSGEGQNRGDDGQQGEEDPHVGLHYGVSLNTPVMTGVMRPETELEALQQTAPHEEPRPSTENVLGLAAALQWAMDTVLTEREKFVVEAIWFERLSYRELEQRLPWGKSQLHRITEAALAKLAQVPELADLRSQFGVEVV